ncbi:ribonuclease H protein, partial [Trifolium medium]|nr:ribonuclease H protein [Trifolium medium]
EWLGGSIKALGSCHALIAELWGVLEGLKLARWLGFDSIKLNVDSSSVAKVIQSGLNNCIGSMLVSKIRRMCTLD